MNNLKEYLEAKKDGFKKTAKRAAITGLVAATILTGAAGLTSCDKDSVQAETKPGVTETVKTSAVEIANSIESKMKETKPNFKLDQVGVVGVDGSYSITIQDLFDKEDGDAEMIGNSKIQFDYDIDKDTFDKIFNLANASKDNSIEVKVINDYYGQEIIQIRLTSENFDKWESILTIVQNHIKESAPSNVVDFAPIMGD